MVAADALAVFASKFIDKRIPGRLVKYSAASVFAVSGMYTLLEALIHRC